MWEKSRGLHLHHYITHIAPEYKSTFFLEHGNCTPAYLLEPTSLSAISTIASIRLSSHLLQCKTRRWGFDEELLRLCQLCNQRVHKTKHHTLLECPSFAHIRTSFAQTLRYDHQLPTFLSQPCKGLAIATFISSKLRGLAEANTT